MVSERGRGRCVSGRRGLAATPPRGGMHVLREHLHVLDRRRGQDAVPEIEDVTRPAIHARQDVVGLLKHPSTAVRAGASGRGCPARRARRRCSSHASSSGMRQSTPITSPPASRSSVEDGRRPGAEVNRRHARSPPPRRCGACAAARTRDSRAASASRPTSRTPARRRRPHRSARRDSRRRSADSFSQSRCQASGCPYISALVLAKLLEWPPSIA